MDNVSRRYMREFLPAMAAYVVVVLLSIWALHHVSALALRVLLALLERQMAERGVEVVLLFGARTPAELLYGDEFRAFADRHPGFRFVPCFSRELPAPGSAQAHPDMRHGYVQQFLDEFAPSGETDLAYLCGNPDMVDACFAALKEHGLAVPQIRRAKYVSTK